MPVLYQEPGLDSFQIRNLETPGIESIPEPCFGSLQIGPDRRTLLAAREKNRRMSRWRLLGEGAAAGLFYLKAAERRGDEVPESILEEDVQARLADQSGLPRD